MSSLDQNTAYEILAQYGLQPEFALRNASVDQLYDEALSHDGAVVCDTGALASMSGAKTGRSPGDKRVVDTRKKPVTFGGGM